MQGIRTPVRKIAGATDIFERVARQIEPILAHVLILLPPSEKKATTAGPAISVYTGVLYNALSWATLTKSAQARGSKSLIIISAKYGVLKPLDVIEPYKQKINAGEMREEVTNELSQIPTELIIDCRSSTYKTVWTPPHEKSVEIKVFTKVDGTKKVITHMSKKTRGEVTRLLLLSKKLPTNPRELQAIVAQHYECELLPASENYPWVLEVIC